MSYTNFVNETVYPKQVLYPESVDDLVKVVNLAKSEKRKIRVAGSHHTFNKLSHSQDILVNTHHLINILEVDQKSQQVTVEAGKNVWELSNDLAAQGLALQTIPSTGLESIGGVVQTGSHGSNINRGNISSTVIGYTMVTPSGQIKYFNKYTSPEFTSMSPGLGTFGIIYSVTLQCELLFDLKQEGEVMDLKTALNNYQQFMQQSSYSLFLVDPYNPRALFLKRTKIPHQPVTYWKKVSRFILAVLAYLVTNTLLPLIYTVTKFIGFLRRPFFNITFNGINYRDQDTYNYITTLPYTNEFIEEEIAIDIHDLPQALDIVMPLLRRFEKSHGLILMLPVSVRPVIADNLNISPANGRDSVYISCIFPQNRKSDAKEFYKEFEELMIGTFNGRPHHGKHNTLTPEKVRMIYPNIDRFIQDQKSLDPTGIFVNEYIRSHYFD